MIKVNYPNTELIFIDTDTALRIISKRLSLPHERSLQLLSSTIIVGPVVYQALSWMMYCTHRNRSWWSRTSCSRCDPAATFRGYWKQSWELFRTNRPACRWHWCSAAACWPAFATSWICKREAGQWSYWGSRRSWWSPAPRTALWSPSGRASPSRPARPAAPGHRRSGWGCNSNQPDQKTSCGPFIEARLYSEASWSHFPLGKSINDISLCLSQCCFSFFRLVRLMFSSNLAFLRWCPESSYSSQKTTCTEKKRLCWL